MKSILDLRFIIGFFFLLVGIFLFVGSFVLQAGIDKSETVNRWCGLFYIVFGLVMLVLWRTGKSEAAEE